MHSIWAQPIAAWMFAILYLNPTMSGLLLVHFHMGVRHVKGDIGHVQEVVREVLLDEVALVAAADHEVIHAIRDINFHNVPNNRLAADLDHRLGLEVGLFGDAGTETIGEDNGFHKLLTCYGDAPDSVAGLNRG